VIEALPRLVKDMPRLAYVIAGEGRDRARLEAKARALGVAGHVVFAGYVPEADKPDLYRLADGFVLAGRGEGFGIVLLEAMASGVPVLGSTRDATREVLADGAAGLLVDPYDAEALPRAIAALLRRPKGVVPAEVQRYGAAAFTARAHAALDRIAALARVR
jgi:glycosyltransferase involved in cell wall biosynthesis